MGGGGEWWVALPWLEAGWGGSLTQPLGRVETDRQTETDRQRQTDRDRERGYPETGWRVQLSIR